MSSVKHQRDYDLVHNYLCGNSDAGHQLFSDIYISVKKYIYSKTQGSALTNADKESVFSDTMFRSIERLDRYNGDSSFKTFVCGIANNVILEYLKKASKQQNIISLDLLNQSDDDTEIPFYGITPEQYVLRKETQEEVQAILNALPPEYRDILILRISKGLPYKTIAALSGDTIDALESRFRRALVEFRKKYKK